MQTVWRKMGWVEKGCWLTPHPIGVPGREMGTTHGRTGRKKKSNSCPQDCQLCKKKNFGKEITLEPFSNPSLWKSTIMCDKKLLSIFSEFI